MSCSGSKKELVKLARQAGNHGGAWLRAACFLRQGNAKAYRDELARQVDAVLQEAGGARATKPTCSRGQDLHQVHPDKVLAAQSPLFPPGGRHM